MVTNESRKNRNAESKTDEKIVELDTLRSFTIPKTKKSNKGILTSLSLLY